MSRDYTPFQKAIVLLSGGQDSTICLYWALRKFPYVETITFDYYQRHKIEIECAAKISEYLKVKNKIIRANGFKDIGGNALTDDIGITIHRGLPSTFVPGRNLIFITYAAAYCYNKDIPNIILGACQTDYSGYPDCRQNTILAMGETIKLGMDYGFEIHTPLMWKTKAESLKMGVDLGVMEVMHLTHTCYLGRRPPCGSCPACLLRAKSFLEAGIKDPLITL